MIEQSAVLFFWTETPLHAGGSATTGAIDLPIQRDRQTGHPMVQASGIKGALRDHCDHIWNANKPLTSAVFGPDTQASEYAGALSVSDARILLFPVRSLRGVCAWITCPLALAYLFRDLSRSDLAESFPRLPAELPAEHQAWVSPQSPIAFAAEHDAPQEVVLEEYTLPAANSDYVIQVAQWMVKTAVPTGEAYAFWRMQLLHRGSSHLIILSDDAFKTFVEGATDVVQRIRINDETGTTHNMGLWTEENLPGDCLLYNVLHASPPRGSSPPDELKEEGKPSAARVLDTVRTTLTERPLIQIGGNETIGRGLTRLRPFSRNSAGAAKAVDVPQEA